MLFCFDTSLHMYRCTYIFVCVYWFIYIKCIYTQIPNWFISVYVYINL